MRDGEKIVDTWRRKSVESVQRFGSTLRTKLFWGGGGSSPAISLQHIELRGRLQHRQRWKELDRRMKSALFGGQSCVELTIPQMTTQRSGITGAGFLAQALPLPHAADAPTVPSSTVAGLLAVLEVAVSEPFIL